MVKFNFLKKIQPKATRTISKHSDKLLLGAQIGGGLIGTFGAMKTANAFLDEAEEFGDNVSSSTKILPIFLIGGGFMMLMMM